MSALTLRTGNRIDTVATALGRRIGLTSGQIYTVVTGVVVAVVLALVGLPPVLRGQPGIASTDVVAPLPAVDENALPSDTPVSPPVTTAVPSPLTATPTAGLPVAPKPTDPATPPAVAPATTPPPPPAPHTVSVLAELDQTGSPGGLAVAADGTVYVVTDDTGPDPSRVIAVDPAGRTVGSWPVPGQPSNRRVGLTGVTIGGDGRVVVVDASRSTILFLDPVTGSMTAGPRIRDVPACLLGVVTGQCEPGLLSSPPSLTGVAVAPDGALYVSDAGQAIIWRVEGDSVRVFTSFDDRLPGAGPVGVSVDRHGDLVVPVVGRFLTLPPGGAGVYSVRIVNGRSQPPLLEFEFASGQDPADLAVGDSGRVYVAVPGRNQVLDIGLDADDRIPVEPGTTPFVRPGAVAVTDGALLVAGRAEQGDRWVIHSVPVLDRPARADR